MKSAGFLAEEVVVRALKLPLKEPFTTSLWTTAYKAPIIVEIRGQGISGWGEGAVPLYPFYNHETPQTALHVLKDFALPIFWRERPESPQALALALKRIQRNSFAKAALEMAYWDFCAKINNLPLYRFLGGTRNSIPVGVSVGIQKDTQKLLDDVSAFHEQGYQRIKIKIAPGKDLQFVEAILSKFPSLNLMVDANSAYTLETASVFREMERFNLLMIEQPLHETDIYEHSLLQKDLRNPICLDESIESLREAKAAVALGACRIINIKPGRVAGLSEALAIHDFCAQANIPVWCGGMLESGIGRAINMALATLPNFRLPGDISESKRYYHEDIVEPEIVLRSGGMLNLPEGPGIGFEVNLERLKKLSTYEERFGINNIILASK